jgi:putative zinc finger/helix-turn-helix YgiT family protein
MKRCYECKSKKLVATKVELSRTIAGRTFKAKVKATRCAECGERTYAGDDLGAFDLAVAGELARHGQVSAEAFSFTRRALGMRALELAELLDVTNETISRWEHGKQSLDRRAVALLASIVLDRLEGRTTTLDRLKALLKPERLPRLVHLVPRQA